MRIAVIGAGISGLTCARLLSELHDVTVFEAEGRIGGHSNTVNAGSSTRPIPVDTGFIVYNDRTYPNFRRLLQWIGVEGRPTSMGFAVRCERDDVEYCGTGLAGVFAQRRNIFKPSFLRMVSDILRFNRIGMRDAQDVDAVDDGMTVGEYLLRHKLSESFARMYLLPMGAAIWSCPTGRFADFPMKFILEFYRNHGLMQLRDRPTWYTIPGGSRRYVEALTRPFQDRILTGQPVQRVQRTESSVIVTTGSLCSEFDEVVFACHSDQALKILADPTSNEADLLSQFPYSENEAVLHTDTSVLPRRPRVWSAWNYRISTNPEARPEVTYCMNILQHIESKDTFCVTLNPSEPIDASRVISRHHYSHPVFTVRRAAAQSRHGELIRSVRTSYCGAYWGNGFHEDGVNSALKVCRAFGIGLPRTGESRPQFFESQPTEPLLAAAGSCIHA